MIREGRKPVHPPGQQGEVKNHRVSVASGMKLTATARKGRENPAPPFVYLVPFVVLIYAPWATFRLHHAVPTQAGAAVQGISALGFENDPTLLIVRLTAYVLALLLVAKRMQATIAIARAKPWFAALAFYVLTSMFWSSYPGKVFINFGHMVGLGLSVLSLQIYFQSRLPEFFFFLARLMAPIVFLSLLVALLFPSYGVSLPDIHGSGGGRWQGITNNSNTLGLLAMVSVWANVAAWRTAARKRKVWIGVFTVVSLIALLGARSSTSIALALLCIAAIPLLAGLEMNSRAVRLIKLAMFGLGAIVLLVTLLAFAPERLGLENFFALFGRSATLSGRTVVWAQALSLIAERPWLGWSFDSNISVLTRSGRDVIARAGGGQFHNGYLDLLVRGGILGLTLLLPMLLGIIGRLRVFGKENFGAATSFLVLFIVILLHNVTEASLARENALLWALFVFLYYAVDVSAVHKAKLRDRRRGRLSGLQGDV